MKPLRIIAFAACVGMALAFGNSCKRSVNEDPKPVPVDSNTKQASRNCIDSVVGIYYGWSYAFNREYRDGKTVANYTYDGPDTVELFKVNDSMISVLGNHLYGPSRQFLFDTTGIMEFHVVGDPYSLRLKPPGDSAEFMFQHYDNPANGYHVYSRFRGKKQ